MLSARNQLTARILYLMARKSILNTTGNSLCCYFFLKYFSCEECGAEFLGGNCRELEGKNFCEEVVL